MLTWVLRIVERDLGRGVLGDEFGIARDIALRLLEIRLGSRRAVLDLLDLRFDRAAVEREQEIAFAHDRPVAKVHADDLAIDAGLDRDAGDRSDAAERFDAHRNGLLGDGRRPRPGRRAARSGAAPARRRPRNQKVPRVAATTPAAASTATAPSTNSRFFIPVPSGAFVNPPDSLHSCAPLITILFGMRAEAF